MEALLGMGIDMGDSPRSKYVCNSTDDVQAQLHSILDSKRTETRVEHVSKSFELGYNTVFDITDEPENGALERTDLAEQRTPPVTRTVNASETVLNQPSDDPKLQRAVAKHIIGAIGHVDGSTWMVQSVSRGSQGWTFTYQCKNSLQVWNRQNAKNPARPAIGVFSGTGGLDAINISRPAFDCRGTLTIAFSNSSRAVVVKYEHQPLHKTVSELLDSQAPTPPPPVTNGTVNMTKISRAKRPPPAKGEEGGSKKKKRKRKAAEEVQNGTPYQMANPEPVIPTSVLNVSPAEAAERKALATELLLGKNIDPSTLSEEQFNIFENQAQNLQEQSLELLAKYGAERLRIVHFDENTQPASSSATPVQQDNSVNSPANDAAPATHDTPTKKKRSKKKKSDGAAVEASVIDTAVSGEGETATTTMAMQPKRRVRTTRGACNRCKERKEKPRRKSVKSGEVTEAEDSDLPDEAAAREHNLQEPDVVSGYPDPEPDVASGDVAMPPQHAAPAPTPAAAPAPMDPGNDEFYPDPNILSGPIETPIPVPQPATSYFQSQSRSRSRSRFRLDFPPSSRTRAASRTGAGAGAGATKSS